jgi:hypothetical protein
MCRLLFFAMMSAACLHLTACSTEQPASQQATPASPTENGRTLRPDKPDPVVKQRDPALEEAWRKAEGEIANEMREVQGSYGAKELAAGARPRTWPPLQLSDTGVTAKLTTTWSNLAVDYKITFSGNRASIERFLDKHQRMRVRLAQPNGITTTQFPISANEFRLTDKAANAHATSQAIAVGNTQSGLLRYLQAQRWYIVWLE